MKQQIAIIKPQRLASSISATEAFAATSEAILDLQRDMERISIEIADYKAKREIARELSMRTNAFTNRITRRENRLVEIEHMIEAYQSGFLEMPNMDPRAHQLEDEEVYGVRLSPDVPMRVFRAVKEAKEAGCFEYMVVFQQVGADPIVAGVIAERRFLISAWR